MAKRWRPTIAGAQSLNLLDRLVLVEYGIYLLFDMGAKGTLNKYSGVNRTEDDVVDAYEGGPLGVYSSCLCPLYKQAVSDANQRAGCFNGFLIGFNSQPGA